MDSFAFGPRRRSHRAGRRGLVVGLSMGLAFFLIGATAQQLIQGNGFGRGRAGIWTTLTIVPNTAAATGELVPDGDAAVAFDVTNPAPFGITVQSVTPGTGPFARYAATPAGSGADASACLISLNQANMDGYANGVHFNPGQTIVFLAPNALHMGSNPDASCQQQSFDISLHMTASIGP